MFTDIVGFSAATQANEAEALRLLGEEEGIVRPLFVAHQGREIKSTGDGFLVEFGSALRAVQCGIDIQEHLRARNELKGIKPIVLRIGIHLGDVEERGRDIFGDAVNIASRVEPLANPGGICITGEVFNQVRNKLPNRFERLGLKTLKNIQHPVETYRLALPWESTPEVSPETTQYRLAVLPLVNISPDPKDEYFADGLTEELISTLSRIQDLRVIARTSVIPYKSTPKSVSQICAELGVSSVLEGSVRKAGNRLRISLQLIDAGSQEHIWAESYDRELNDVFAIQTEIALGAARALRLELAGPKQGTIAKKVTPDLAAYNLYLRGIHAARVATPEGSNQAIAFFEDAIRKDPGFSQAYSQLANIFVAQSGDSLSPHAAFPRARELVSRALQIDPNSSEVHTVLGNLALQHDHDWAAAEREFTRAISLNPSNSGAHFWYAFLLAALQRFEEALAELRITIELDPLWTAPTVQMMVIQFYTRDFASAIASAEEERNRSPESPGPHIRLGICYLRAGRTEDARREAEVADRLRGPGRRLDGAVLRAGLGEPEEARELAAEWTEASRTKYVQSAKVAILFAAMRDKERAFEWLERDYQSGDRFLWNFYQWREFDSIRDDPRFDSILRKLNLPTGKWQV